MKRWRKKPEPQTPLPTAFRLGVPDARGIYEIEGPGADRFVGLMDSQADAVIVVAAVNSFNSRTAAVSESQQKRGPTKLSGDDFPNKWSYWRNGKAKEKG